MGLTSVSLSIPTPSLVSRVDQLIGDHGLVGVHGDVLDGDLLLPTPAVAVKSLGEHGDGSGRLVGQGEVPRSGLEALLRDPGAPIEVKAGVVGGDHLGGDHRLDGVGRRQGYLTTGYGLDHVAFLVGA